MNCQLCEKTITNNDVLYCKSCDAPHHSACWDIGSCCSSEGCSAKEFSVRPQKMRSTPKEEEASVELESNEQDRGNRHHRLELSTPLESGLPILAILLVLLGFGAASSRFGKEAWNLAKILWPIALFLAGLRLFVDCAYVLDNVTKELLYVMHFFGTCKSWRVCGFDDILCVKINNEEHRGRRGLSNLYTVLLVLRNDTRVLISEKTSELSKAEEYGRQLAKHIGVKAVVNNEPVTDFDYDELDLPMEDSSVFVDHEGHLRASNWHLMLLFAIIMIGNVALFHLR